MSAERPAYVQFYASDWKGGTAGLPPIVEWTYLQICLFNWDKGEPLPASQFRLVLARNPEWEADLELLIEAGKVIRNHSGAIWVQRAMIEAERAEASLARKKNAGKKGAKKRWENSEEDSTANATAMPNQCDTISNQNQNQNQNQREDKSSPPHSPPTGDDGENGDLIFSVPPDIWKDFKEHRRKLKAPMTARAEKQILKKLEELWHQGHDPTALLEQSIERGWKFVFPIKGDGSGWDFTK